MKKDFYSKSFILIECAPNQKYVTVSLFQKLVNKKHAIQLTSFPVDGWVQRRGGQS